eukprot:m.877793 g.877793  ORF g.877793 m.877793 type:complete len:64 (+) comp23583_c0_seq11:34-225(+)
MANPMQQALDVRSVTVVVMHRRLLYPLCAEDLENAVHCEHYDALCDQYAKCVCNHGAVPCGDE